MGRTKTVDRRRVIITGVGYKESAPARKLDDIFASKRVKPNIGASVALSAAIAGNAVVLIARTAAKLERVKAAIAARLPKAVIACEPTDVLDPRAVLKLVGNIPHDLEIDLVQCAGVSAGSFRTEGDNVFFPIEETSLEMPSIEFESVVRSLLVLVQSFLPRLKSQKRSTLVVVASMSGIRAFPFGFSHCAAKGGLHQAIRSLSLELSRFGVRVCEVNPGIVDTGLYDSPEVDTVVRRISRSFDYDYAQGKLPAMEALAVADAVVLCLQSKSHILSINMVADGQFPHHGA